MSMPRITKSFKLEVAEGGKAIVTLDGEIIPGVTSYYINNDAEEQELVIELWKADNQGGMEIMNVTMAL
jgi:hypothetical protein